MKRVHLYSYFLFLAIFVGYFASAAGLYNSLDTPQFFTTEALMKNHNLDISPFQGDPHYFVHPDYIMLNGSVLGLRGYMQSVLSIPFHVVGRIIAPLYITTQFPVGVRTENFSYELAVTSLYSIFMLIGLFFIWKVMCELTKNEKLAGIITFGLAFGTYFWKYSTMYARQSPMIMILGMTLYGMYHYAKNKKPWSLGLILFGFSLAFGIDSVLFLSVLIACLTLLKQFAITFLNKKDQRKRIIVFILPGLLILLLNIFANYYWYKTWSFAQYYRHDLFESIPTAELHNFLLSVPLFPTLWYVLFSIGRLDPGIFSYIEKYPKVAFIFSVEYAKKYIFYGIFAISPFFWPIIFQLKVLMTSKERIYYLACATLFVVGIIINTKWFAFYAANQYDVRYFYPFLICLAPMLAASLQAFQKKGALTLFINALFGLSLAWSIFMGWLGELSMLLPALTGERRVWVDVYNSLDVLKMYSVQDLWYYTFMNWTNAWLGCVIFILLVGFFIVVKERLRIFLRRVHLLS